MRKWGGCERVVKRMRDCLLKGGVTNSKCSFLADEEVGLASCGWGAGWPRTSHITLPGTCRFGGSFGGWVLAILQ